MNPGGVIILLDNLDCQMTALIVICHCCLHSNSVFLVEVEVGVMWPLSTITRMNSINFQPDRG